MSMDSKRTGRNCNLVVLGSTDAQFRALASENIRQGLCNYVVATSSAESYQSASQQLVKQGYDVYICDLTYNTQSKISPVELLTQSVATAIFLLFDPSNQASCRGVSSLLSDTTSALLRLRRQAKDGYHATHIQFFIDGFTELPPIRKLSCFLANCKKYAFSVVFTCPDAGALERRYPTNSQEILDCCDNWLFYRGESPRHPRLSRLFSLLWPAQCQLQAVGDIPRSVIPIEGSDSHAHPMASD